MLRKKVVFRFSAFPFILFLIFFFYSPFLMAQTLQLKQLQAPTSFHNAWRLVFTSDTPIYYRSSYNSQQRYQFILNIHNGNTFQQMVNPQHFTSSPIAALKWSIMPAQHLQLSFAMREPVSIHTVSIKTLQHNYQLTVDVKQMTHTQNLPLAFIKKSGTPSTVKPTMKLASASSLPYTAAVNLHALRQIIVVIDPGHGGKDPGTIGVNRVTEKEVVLDIAQRLKALINQQPGFQAILTRQGDYFLPLRQRLLVARQRKADLFIAIHADAGQNHSASGATVYALSQRGATSEAARWIAQRENQSELLGGVKLIHQEDTLRSVLINLSQTATIQDSLFIGKSLLAALHPFTRLHYSVVEQAAFVVLKSPDIPSVLVETGYLSNPKEACKLHDPHYQQWIASALMQGIKSYFTTFPPPGTWLANHHGEHRRYADQRQFLNIHKG